MVPYYKNDKGILYYGDALDISRRVKPESVHCCVTSPPYWGLRSYFDSDENQLGLEKTPELYVEHLVEIFKGIKKVLHPSGVIWLVIDDTYSVPSTKRQGELGMDPRVSAKNMIGIPYKTVLALQKDGWVWRCDCIWDAPNKRPEPMDDRPTRTHEYVYFLTKEPYYFYDKIPVFEKIQHSNKFAGDRTKVKDETGDMFRGGHMKKRPLAGKNMRAILRIPIEPTKDPHHAAFPSKLVAKYIKAGTSLKGCCSKCFAPIKRIVEPEDPLNPYESMKVTVGWEPTCKCNADIIPCTVLDPFAGRGTTLMTAEDLGRNWIGVEITPESIEIAKQNIVNRKLGLLPTNVDSIQNGLFNKDELDIAVK